MNFFCYFIDDLEMYKFLIPIVIIIIILFIGNLNVGAYEQFIEGLWIGDETFCKEAGISLMMVYIGPPKNGWLSRSRNGYIIIHDDAGAVLANEGFLMNYRAGWGGPIVSKYSLSATVDFDHEQLWAENGKVRFSIDVIGGVMRIFAADTMYCKLIKVNQS